MIPLIFSQTTLSLPRLVNSPLNCNSNSTLTFQLFVRLSHTLVCCEIFTPARSTLREIGCVVHPRSRGCAARVADRLHVNGAIAYTPSVDYEFGSTPSVGGRVGFSFPLGKVNKPKQELAKLDHGHQQAMAKLVDQRDDQIANLTEQLEKLQQSAGSSEANEQLIALLRERIEELEDEKQQADAENQRQDDKIKQLETKLSKQQSLMERMIKQMKKLMPKGG